MCLIMDKFQTEARRQELQKQEYWRVFKTVSVLTGPSVSLTLQSMHYAAIWQPGWVVSDRERRGCLTRELNRGERERGIVFYGIHAYPSFERANAEVCLMRHLVLPVRVIPDDFIAASADGEMVFYKAFLDARDLRYVFDNLPKHAMSGTYWDARFEHWRDSRPPSMVDLNPEYMLGPDVPAECDILPQLP